MEVRFTDSFYKSIDKLVRRKNPFSSVFWIVRYRETKKSIRSILAYLGIVSRMRDWDYVYILEMMRFQIKKLRDHMEKYSYEIERDKKKKIQQMDRAIEILDGIIKDDYHERVGWNPEEYDSFEAALDDLEQYTGKARELEEKEWKSLWQLLSNCMSGWWD